MFQHHQIKNLADLHWYLDHHLKLLQPFVVLLVKCKNVMETLQLQHFTSLLKPIKELLLNGFYLRMETKHWMI